MTVVIYVIHAHIGARRNAFLIRQGFLTGQLAIEGPQTGGLAVVMPS